jgi:hypothetical protein
MPERDVGASSPLKQLLLSGSSTIRAQCAAAELPHSSSISGLEFVVADSAGVRRLVARDARHECIFTETSGKPAQ